jgi:phosphohistidine phosphatase
MRDYHELRVDMRVYLVQHGESRPEEEDPQRSLTDEGVRNVQNIARFLRPLGLKLETIWHSGKHRAQQTAEILAGAVSASQGILQRNGLAPKDPVAPVKQAIEESVGDLMIVGHLPFLGKLAALLVADSEETEVVAFRFGCVVCVERVEDGAWKLAWMIVPALLGAQA